MSDIRVDAIQGDFILKRVAPTLWYAFVIDDEIWPEGEINYESFQHTTQFFWIVLKNENNQLNFVFVFNDELKIELYAKKKTILFFLLIYAMKSSIESFRINEQIYESFSPSWRLSSKFPNIVGTDIL